MKVFTACVRWYYRFHTWVEFWGNAYARGWPRPRPLKTVGAVCFNKGNLLSLRLWPQSGFPQEPQSPVPSLLTIWNEPHKPTADSVGMHTESAVGLCGSYQLLGQSTRTRPTMWPKASAWSPSFNLNSVCYVQDFESPNNLLLYFQPSAQHWGARGFFGPIKWHERQRGPFLGPKKLRAPQMLSFFLSFFLTNNQRLGVFI